MWLSLGLSCLPCSASWINGFMSLDKFGKFSTRFLQVLFQPNPLSPFWLRLWWHKYLIFCYNPMGPWGSIHFFFFFPLCFLDLVIFIVFQFTDTPNLTFCCWFYPLNFSFQLASISVLKSLPFFNSLYFSGTLYFFPEAFYLHICFNFISIYSLKYFIIVALKSWSNNSNISVILILAPIDCLFFPLVWDRPGSCMTSNV